MEIPPDRCPMAAAWVFRISVLFHLIVGLLILAPAGSLARALPHAPSSSFVPRDLDFLGDAFSDVAFQDDDSGHHLGGDDFPSRRATNPSAQRVTGSLRSGFPNQRLPDDDSDSSDDDDSANEDKALFVGNLDPRLTELDIVTAFEQFGDIRDVSMPLDRRDTDDTGANASNKNKSAGSNNRGFCFIQYDDVRSVDLALHSMKG